MPLSSMIAVPIMLQSLTPHTQSVYLEKMRQIGAQRIWIALERDYFFQKDRSAALARIAENLAFFEQNGIEAGLWLPSLGFGNPLDENARHVTRGWTQITSVHGQTMNGDAFCPEDSQFTEAYCGLIHDLAMLHPRLIMLDDEHCLSVRPGLGCFCPHHRKMMEEVLEEPLPDRDLDNLFFTGPGNRYRDTWLDVMRGTHLRFYQKIRNTIDLVDPTIRAGICAGITSWDIEGATAIEMCQTLAGHTRPFLRLTGAPYWAAEDLHRFSGFRLGSIIELCRAQEFWTRGQDIEIFDENDSFPRPSFHVPASLVENMDLALRANGGIGSLKYVFDYVSSPDYEPAYLRNHKRNIPFYRWIQQHFSDKASQGVRVYRKMQTIRQANLPDSFISEQNIMIRFFPPAASLLSQHSIPITYEQGQCDCGIAFGDDILTVDTMPPKMILDFPAALALQDRGIDLGIRSWSDAGIPAIEHFAFPTQSSENVDLKFTYEQTMGKPRFYRCVLDPHVQIESTFGSEDFPGSYVCHFENTTFLVYLFDVQTVNPASSLLRSYCRQQQLLTFIQGDFPVISHVPGIYTLYKSDGRTAAALFENLSADVLFDFDITLGRPCRSVELFGAQGTLSEDGLRIHIASDVPAYTAIAVAMNYRQ